MAYSSVQAYNFIYKNYKVPSSHNPINHGFLYQEHELKMHQTQTLTFPPLLSYINPRWLNHSSICHPGSGATICNCGLQIRI